METSGYLAIVIFIIVYAFIVSEKVAPSVVALLGASVMIITGIISQQNAFAHIDLDVILLLINMMILVHILEGTGLFEYIAIYSAKLVKGNPVGIMIMLFWVTAVFSAFLDNVTTVVLITPIAILIANEMRVTPIPLIMTIIFGSNIGGTATLIGDPPNIMIGMAANLTFMDFLINLSPIVVINLIIMAGVFYLLFRKKLHVTNENKARIMDFNEKMMIKDVALLKKSLIVFFITIFGFIFHGMLGLEAATISIFSAALLLLLSKSNAEIAFKKVEWLTIFFFIGLFMIVGGLVETGVINWASQKMVVFTKGDTKIASQVILLFSGVMSALIDNIPYTATMIPLIKEMGAQGMTIQPLWWALSLGACLGGNGTLIGASANVVVAHMSKKSGYPLTFLTFLPYGLLVLAISLLTSYVYILVRYF